MGQDVHDWADIVTGISRIRIRTSAVLPLYQRVVIHSAVGPELESFVVLQCSDDAISQLHSSALSTFLFCIALKVI